MNDIRKYATHAFKTIFNRCGIRVAGRNVIGCSANMSTINRHTAGHKNSHLGSRLLLLLALLVGAVSQAQAGLFCSEPPFNGVVDGFADYSGTVADPFPTQITIDGDCTFKNFTAANPLNVTINYQTNDDSIYLITFDNVVFTGNMACSAIDHKLWVVNSAEDAFKSSCQDIIIPAETIAKEIPAPSAGIGDPFTYTLTLPSMEDTGLSSPNDLGNIILTDNLNALGVDLTLVGTPVVNWSGGGAVAHTFTNTAGLLSFVLPNISAGEQIIIEITVVLDDTAANIPGTQFTNIAQWTFSRWIDLDENGIVEDGSWDADGDGIIEDEFFDPLPGENGISLPMTIAEPDLVVSKTSTETALNLGIPATFTIDVQNNGGSDAWHTSILDLLPDTATAGTCDADPTTSISAQIFAADGVTSVSGLLAPGFDYSVAYSGAPTCELSLTMLTAKAVIAPTERLIITYDTQLDADTTADGVTLTNIAGATEWFSANGSHPRITYSRTLSDGTPAIVDHEDSYTITTALSGYYFQKTVQNLTTGANPATNAVPSDTLRYRLRVFNVDETIDTITITDTLDPTKFDTSTFSMIAFPAGSTYSFDLVTGELRVFGFPNATSLNVSQGSELIVDFEIDLAAGLSNGDVVPNQATLSADGPLVITSDDPYVNGIAAPGDSTDTTNVVIQAPGPLSKVEPAQTTASIGEQFTYTITVPAVAVNVPLYDVRITDDLTASNADLSFVSATVVSGGSWVLSNTGTATNVVIEDTATGIDIAANSQAVIDITVELQNTAQNNAGLDFINTASYTYNRANGDIGTQTLGSAGSSVNMTVIEPAITTITKTADKTTPTAGEIVRYSVTLDTSGGADFSDVFDVTITDSLSAGLVYEGNPTVTVGAGVSADNTIGAPDITGDGSAATPQILVWSLGNADIDIVEGTSLTISYDVRVLNSVLANQTLTNSAVAQWTSIDGVSTGERSGIDGVGGLNDYITAAVSVSVTTPDIISTITKIRSSDTYGAGDDDVRIGDLVEYELRIAVPEGTLGNLQLVDTLPQGLKYEGIVSINGDVGPAPYTAVAPFSHADVLATDVVEAGDAITGSTTVTWSLSDITNLPNDGLSDDFVIIYRARVLNGVFTLTDTSIPLNNSVTMSYDTAAGNVTNSDLVTPITALQPLLTVTKSAAPAGGDTVIDANEVITYTVEVSNSGDAPAYDTVVEDILPVGLRQGGVTTTSITLVNAATTLALIAPSYNSSTGLITWDLDSGTADTHTIPIGETLRIIYTVQVDAVLAQGLTLTNTASSTVYYSFDDEAVPTLGSVTGIRETYGPTNTASTTLYTGALPTKVLLSPASAEATIGEEVVYQITVPGTLSSSALHDVQVIDTLDTNLEFIGATVTGGGVGVTDNSTTSPSVMDISITQIPAGQQVVIELRTRVANVATAQQGVAVNNTASYTYAYTSGGATQSALTSTDIVTVNIIEPNLTVAKAVTLVTATPITGGDILEYVLTIPNTGTATAYDINIVDTLAAQLTLDTSFTPTAAIDTVAVAGFTATPSGSPAGPLVWGQGNGDGSLDIPSGSTLILTYRVVIAATAESNITLSNSVQADWTTLNGSSTYERTGAGCPTVIAPNDYCTVPAIASVTTADSNSFSKIVFEDSYIPVTDATVRIGDTVTYQLTLDFQEGTTRSVVVQDVLPTGLAFVDIVSINGDSVADYDPPASGSGSNFSYATVTSASLPTAGQTGTLNFTLGNVVNDPLGDAGTDSITIFYRARVIENTLAQAASTALNNTATLAYIDGAGAAVVDPARLQSTATTTVLQPVMTVPTKVDSVFISPANVNIATDVMHFTLESCNTTGLAPAYNVQLTDVLATQLDETSIVGPTVTINGAAAVAGTDYTYTAPAARGGSMIFDLLTPVNAGQCVTINYDIGFYTDFGPNQTWNNSVTVNEYWSLPSQSGQQYAALGPTIFTMSNIATIGLPAKTMTSPASGEATIGEEVVYQITVPAVAVNAALYDVVISDTLHASLELISATDISGNGLTITDNTVANNVSLIIAQIPAGQQAVIELRTRVANNVTANAGTSFSNTISYTYATTSGGATNLGGSATTATSLTIIEPLIAINKTVVNNTNVGNPPVAGDVLRYSLTFTASGAGAGDNFANAFDLSIIDSLSLGLAYQTATTTVDAGNTIADPIVVGDGSGTAQTLTWHLADATADIDVVEGTTVTVTYDVVVLDSVLANQTLSNSAIAQWTSIDGINVNERNGTTTPVENDYVTAAVITTLTTPDTTTLSKLHLTDTYGAGDANVRIGDLIEYELRVALQEGQHNNVVLTDSLPQGLAFENIAQINGDTTSPYSAVAPFVHSDITPVVSGDPATGPSSVTFTLGTVTNVADNNAANDEFVIVYRARVLDSVHAQANNITLTNNAQLDYTTASGAAQQTASASSTLLQPNLAVTKLAAPVGGDTIINAGELVTYTVDVINSGTAPAYDVVVQDTIPVGMRNGTATITMVSTTLVNAATSLTNLTPIYDAATGVAIWDFDASIYSIAAGETLRIVYQVQADVDLGAGLTLTNQVVGNNYYSFDDEAVPTLGGINGVREIYGPTTTATTTLTSPTPGALLKENPADLTVAVGETFTYRITVPATPLQIALHDVRIIDDLNASAADLTYLSVAKVSGSQPWTPENTGTAKNLIIEDTTNGIDIPAGEQVVIEITVVVDDTGTNVSGLLFSNTATYTYNQLQNDSASQQNGAASTTTNMTIVGPDNLTLTKTGPATIRYGVVETFTLNIQNTGTAPAWDITVSDILPTFDPAAGGMCDTAPTNITAQMYLADGTTTVGGPLVQGTDYVTSYSGCTLTLTMQSTAAALVETNRLIITYDAQIDLDTQPNSALTNIAGVTEWFSGDTAGAGATGQIKTFSRTVTNGTVGTLDHEDAFTTTSEIPTLTIEKRVVNVTTGQDPGANASPGDTLRYGIYITNTSSFAVNNFTFTDDLDALNATTMFVAGSLNLITVPATADSSNTDVNGGSKGTGLVDIRNLSMGATGSGSETVVIEFEVKLVASIASGTTVYNQGHMDTNGLDFPTDDPNIGGATDPTETIISSAPQFEVFKTSTDLTGDANILLPGDTLRYTITVKNIGTEDTINAILKDQLPANTTYVAGSTTLNGSAVTEPTPGLLPLQSGILINAPEDTTAGVMRADATATTANVATITFNVTINSSVVNGTIISNQGYISASGTGSGAIADTPSDDPATSTLNDPTRDVIGNQPLLDAHKTVSIQTDNNSNGELDPGDTLRYTITISNIGAAAATDVNFVDAVPVNTTYVADSVTLNTLAVAQPDGGVSPLIAGIPASSSDLTPPLPTAGNGIITAGQVAVITFDVTVNAGVVAGTIISNQGSVSSNELPVEPTDADGIDSNGDQPTLIVVGNAALISITKTVSVVGGGAALAGGQLEYRVLVTNISSVAATNVIITDNLDLPVAGQLIYVNGSGLLNGSTTGISYTAPTITANYSASYGNLLPGQTAELVFRATIDNSLAIGTTITNTGVVSWDATNANASISIDVGGTPGVANVNGQVWHDKNYDNVFDAGELVLAGWYVDIYRNTTLLGTVTTDSNGNYSINGLIPNDIGSDRYDIRFRAPGSNSTTAKLGRAYSEPALAYTDDLHRIYNIVLSSGENVQNLNLPIDPNGVVYNSIIRTVIPGATISLLNAGTGSDISSSCFDDVNQQNQVTTTNGYYKFDLNFSQGDCIAGADYLVRITPPATGYSLLPSAVITPQTDATTAALDVPNCPGTADDDVATPAGYCEVQVSELAPTIAVAPASAGTSYYLHLTLNNGSIPGDSQIFNNHLPIDPILTNAVSITKTSSLANVTRGKLVPYTITFSNTLTADLYNSNIVDDFPAGFKYVEGSARFNNGSTVVPLEPVRNGLQLTWSNIDLPIGQTQTIKLLLIVGAAVNEGKYENKAYIFDSLTNTAASGVAVATVRVIADPDFDCSDVIGKVFDDKNLNGYQDEKEKGLAGVKLVTVRGLVSTSDKYGRFHVTCAVAPDESRGSNFVIKLDERTLPSGYRMTTENPRVQRATSGKMLKFNFGSALHRVVSMDLADGVFVANSIEMHKQWIPRIDLLIKQLQEKPSILRLSYLADVDDESIVEDRLEKVKQDIIDKWLEEDKYKLTIESEIFWRRGGPPDHGDID